ncbi:MAG: hemoglobin [Myxococcota bacterium]|jgi:hemoglobin
MTGVEASLLAPQERFSVAAITDMVDRFYTAIREDPLLGPPFATRIESWSIHLPRMVTFWRSILRRDPGFKPGPKGPPPFIHRRFEELTLAHYERWLALFQATAQDVFEPAEAAHVHACACRMADVFTAPMRGDTQRVGHFAR